MDKVFSLRIAACFGLAAVFAGLPSMEAAAQKVDFADKRVEFVVPFPPGGGADVYMRVLAPFLEKHLPGKPTMMIRNVPGGGSITGANQFHARAKPDGLHVFVFSSSTIMNFVFQRSKFDLDVNKMQPVLLSPQGSVVYVSPALGVTAAKDIAKLKGQALAFGGGGATGAELRVTTAFDLLGLNVKYVWGIARGPVRLAFERGELNINYDTTPAYTKNVSQLIKAGKAAPLFAMGVLDEKGGVRRDPNFPNLPNFPEVYELMHGKKPSGPAYEAWKAILNMSVMANKGLLLPAGTPPPIVAAWRSALQETLADSEFQAKAAKIIEGYPQFVGEAARPILNSATTPSPEVWEWIKNFLKTKHDVTL